MAAASRSLPSVREAVASFPDRAHFRRAVSALLAAGFAPSALSVLATHEALDAVEAPGGAAAGMVPAGLSLLSGGPIAATVAALVGAGLGAAALKEIFGSYTAPRHRENFEAALKAGAALLWVRVDDPERERIATRILTQSGGQNVHVHTRARPREEGEG